ncbi:MAG: protein kinase [Muribaculaceae bacterium]|nr:protein kinase [Muribaculaceae bacterium]
MSTDKKLYTDSTSGREVEIATGPTPPPTGPWNPPGQSKWTEVEHLPQWDEEFYDVYTAKKHGKWLMLKTLRPEFKGNPEMEAMIEKEFDVRYNLAHPAIVMINDFEEVPGLGRCIITDDVYGDPLSSLIEKHAVTPKHIERLRTQLVSALEYIQQNHLVHHPIRPERIIFTENIGNLKLIDVGFDQRSSLSPAVASEDINNYGMVLLAALNACDTPFPDLRRVAERCVDPRRRYRNVQSLRLALENRRSNRLLIVIIAFLAIMIALLAFLNSRPLLH